MSKYIVSINFMKKDKKVFDDFHEYFKISDFRNISHLGVTLIQEALKLRQDKLTKDSK